MNGCLPNWKMEDDSKPFHGQDNELIELLRRNRHAILHRQTNCNAPPESLLKCGDSIVNSSNFIAEEETAPWFQFPSDNSIEREFSEFFYGIPTAESMSTDKSLKEDANICAKKSSFHPYENVILPPKSSFDDSAAIETFTQLGKLGKAGLVSEKRNLCEEASSTESVVAMGASSSMRKLLSGVCGSNEAQKISSSSGGSRRSTTNHGLKRRRRDAEESEGYSEEADYESAEANKSAQPPASSRRSRSAEVHNLSERRRRDKINEKMRALQELIPHCNKSDKASMLDEAIEYLKSLQSQLQIMWMGNGMAPMLFPSIQQYLPGTDIRMNHHHLPRSPSDVQSTVPGTSIPNQPPASPLEAPNSINSSTQLHNFHLPERYSSYFGFPQMQMSPQVMNMCTYGAQMMEQNQMVAVVEKQQHANNKSST